MRIKPVILSGGSGTRLWPLSRAHLPKQFLKVHDELTLFQRCLSSVSSDVCFEDPDVICSAAHRFIVQDQAEAVGASISNIILEPQGRNTGPAVAIAALMAAEADPNRIVAVLPSDTFVEDHDELARSLLNAAATAQAGHLSILGVRPERPETGFGYIEVLEPLVEVPGCFSVRAFVEKPNAVVAAELLASGKHLWNCGIFVFSASTALAAFQEHRPDLLPGANESLHDARRSGGVVALGEAAFGTIDDISFDKAVLERSRNLTVSELKAKWSDLGSWQTVAMIAEQDGEGNTTLGDVISMDVSSSYLRSEGPLVAAIGIQNVIVVATDDSVLIADVNRSQDVKELVAKMSRQGRTEHLSAKTAFRPWGHYKELDRGRGFRVKLVHLKPGGTLSLQRHRHRSEHWVIVSGVAQVTRGSETFRLKANESTFIPQMTVHRLENPTEEPLELIEVQTGDILEEADIERFRDIYGRVE